MENQQKDLIVAQLREAGCRITKQRMVILDIILNQDPSCCKEIYREAAKIDKNIGAATVYRMVNTLEEIGVLSRKNMYQVDCSECGSKDDCDKGCVSEEQTDLGCPGCNSNVLVELSDGRKILLNRAQLKETLFAGLKQQGKINSETITKVLY